MLKELCKQHFIEIILLLRESPKSFNELLKLLNAYPDTLNRRLKELSEMNIILQVQESEKLKYKLTQKGFQVAEVLEDLLEIIEKLKKIIEKE